MRFDKAGAHGNDGGFVVCLLKGYGETMKKRMIAAILAACLVGASLFPTNVSAAYGEAADMVTEWKADAEDVFDRQNYGEAAEKVTEWKADAEDVFYRQNFDSADVLDENGIPAGWRTAGAVGDGIGNLSIETEGERSYFSVDATTGVPKYFGMVLAGAPHTGIIEYDFNLKQASPAKDMGLSFYPIAVNTGNIAIRGNITKDGAVTFFNRDSKITVANIKDAGWVHFKYSYDNYISAYTVEITAEDGTILGKTEGVFAYNKDDSRVGAFSFSMEETGGIIGIDNIEVREAVETPAESEQPDGSEQPEESEQPETPDVTVAETVEGEEETVFYAQSFDDADQLDDSALPNGWATAGKIVDGAAESGERGIRTEGERSYYYVDAKGNDPRYIGKVLTGMSKTGWIEYDFLFTKASDGIGLSSYSNSVNTGNIAIRGNISWNGDVYFYNGATNTKIANLQNRGWVHFKYEFNNKLKIFTVKITDAATGKTIGKTTEAFGYNNASGQVGAFSFSVNSSQTATFGLDEITAHGYPTPFTFEPEIEPLGQTGKVILEDNGDTYTLKNDYCKVVIDKQKAVIRKFYTKEGNEICGDNGDGSYLLNYTDSGHVGDGKQEMTLKNCTGSIIRQTDNLCEVSVKEIRLKKDDNNTLPIDLDFRFVLEKDSPGLYMYAILDENYSDEDIANGRTFNFGQSRYAMKFDYDRLPYSVVQGGEIGGQLVKMAGPGDFKEDVAEASGEHGMLFDSTYVLNDGSIFTKYNNLSYQYSNIMIGAFSDEGGLSLLTPSRDWAGGGYAKQDIDVHGGPGSTFIVSWHLETGHNGTKGVDVEEGYQKVYGPVMWYATTDESISSKEEAYTQTYAQALKEVEKWPYNWMVEEEYPNAEDCPKQYAAATRGSLKGTFSVKNGTINREITNDLTVTDDGTGENSIGWAVLSDERSKYWALDNDYYEFYAPVKQDGTFEIKNIIPGTYKLNINVNGIMDEYVEHNIVIGENEAKDLGNITWDDPIYGKTLWTIGIPDKTAEEYAYAYPCRYWGSHLLFHSLFPDGVDFKVGESDESKDWFFVQMASRTAGHKEHYDGAFYFDEETRKVKYDAARAIPMEEEDSRWRGNELAPYQIRFDSGAAYAEGTGTLLINVCGNRFGSIRATLNGTNIVNTAGQVTVNSEPVSVAESDDTAVVSLYTDGSVGRSGLVGINQLVKIEFDASLIKEGENVILLTHDHPAYQEDNVTPWEHSDYTIYAGNIYDAIRLDVDTRKADDTPDTEKPDLSSESSESTGGSQTGSSESGESTESTGGSQTGSSESSESTENTEGSQSGTSESGESTGGNGTGSSGSTENAQDSQTGPGQPDDAAGNTVNSETKSSEQGGMAGNSETTGTSESTGAKGQTTVVLQNKTVTYNKNAVTIGKAAVTGSTGNVTYLYYTDAACKKQTTKKNSGAAGKGQAPKYAGTYYVTARVAADASHPAAVSNVAKLTIKKAASKVTLKKRTARYTGKAVSVKKATVKGSTGKVTYTYYKDKKCKTKTTKKNAGAAKTGQAPKKTGIYYVKATVKADKNYKAATSKAVKLVIKK